MAARGSIALVVALLSACSAGTDESGGSSSSSSSTSSSSPSPTDPTTGDPDTGADTGCPGPLAACGGACVDLEHDPMHCGGCDAACDPGFACVAGQCGVACGAGAEPCGGACVDLERDPMHCGGCDHACAAGVTCVAGGCALACGDGQVVCGEACVQTASDEGHCGGCGVTCPMGQPCVAGECVATTLHHLLISGQSLSTGFLSPVLSVEQPYANLSFNTGVRAGAVGLTGFVPLIEVWDGIQGETIASGLANLVAELELPGGGHRILASAHGAGGQPYSAIKKGTDPYAAGMAQVTAGLTLAVAAGETYAVRAVAIVHGEADHLNGNLGYDDDLLAWQADYEADVRALTGQTLPVPMFYCQMSSWTALGGGPVSAIPRLQSAAARARPDRMFVVGPKYVLPYVADGVHLSGEGERWLGELYAKVYRRVLIDGERWTPLQPREIALDGQDITVAFDVPAPPLVLDTTMVVDPGNFGFEYFDSSGAPPAISAVTLVDATTVRVTLASPPVGANRRLRYAHTGIPGQPAGPTTGARGNLRDSDMTPSRNGYPLYNWAVHFDEPVE